MLKSIYFNHTVPYFLKTQSNKLYIFFRRIFFSQDPSRLSYGCLMIVLRLSHVLLMFVSLSSYFCPSVVLLLSHVLMGLLKIVLELSQNHLRNFLMVVSPYFHVCLNFVLLLYYYCCLMGHPTVVLRLSHHCLTVVSPLVSRQSHGQSHGSLMVISLSSQSYAYITIV